MRLHADLTLESAKAVASSLRVPEDGHDPGSSGTGLRRCSLTSIARGILGAYFHVGTAAGFLTQGAVTVAPEEAQRPRRFTVELIDRLLLILVGPDRISANQQLIAAGYTEDEIRGAWNFARAAGYLESTGLGMDRLTTVGKARAADVRRSTR